MNTWFYSDTQQTYGPISKGQLVAMIEAGQLVGGHFIMAAGAQEWQAINASPFSGYLPSKASLAMPAHFASAAPQAVITDKPGQAPQFRPAGPRQPQAVKSATGSRNFILVTLAFIVLAAALGCYLLVTKAAPARTIAKRLEGEVEVEVKLQFANAEKYYDVGGYQPDEVILSTNIPRSISKAPAGLVSPVYGELKLGPPASQRSHGIILNNPQKENARLFVDGNANGDLTDDPPVPWQPWERTNLTTGVKWIVSHGYFTVELNCRDGTHRAKFEVFEDYQNGRIADDRLLIHPSYGRVGSVNLNGKSYKALLYDDGSKGDFSATSSTFRLDLAGGSGFRWEEAEVFPVMEFFTVEGMTYQLSGLTPSGDAFKIVPAPSLIGQTAPTLSATTIAGDKISLPGTYPGKIVLLHFWSIGQKLGLDDVPQLKTAYEKHHSAGFDMLGICVEYLRGKALLPAFVKDNNILWPQVYEFGTGPKGLHVLKLFKTHSVPSSFLIDGDTGEILAFGVRGGALDAVITKALAAKNR